MTEQTEFPDNPLDELEWAVQELSDDRGMIVKTDMPDLMTR
ncbi:MAG: hypothetical protein ABIC95_01105 [archaeon]